MKNIAIEIIWDELTERFKEADDISIEDVNLDARKYLTLFLEEGYDANTIAQMLDKHDVFEFYQTLKKNGATEINLIELFEDDTEFIEENFDTFISYGVPVNNIVKAIIADKRYIEEEDLETYVEKGATPRFILGLISKNDDEVNSDFLNTILQKLVVRGCSKSVISAWLKSSKIGKRNEILDDIVEFKTEEWSKVLYPERFVGRWIEYNGYQYIDGTYSLKDLPAIVDYNDVINHYSMREIIEMTSGGRMFDFIDDYRKVGGDPKDLLARFKKEIGEPKSDLEKEAMRDMEDQGLIVIPNDGSSQA